MDHSIGTLGPTTVALLAHETRRELIEHYPGIAQAFWQGHKKSEDNGQITEIEHVLTLIKSRPKSMIGEPATTILTFGSASMVAVLLVTILVPPVMAEVPLPPPRPREQGPVPSPPPAPAQPAPAKTLSAASPVDEECLANLQKLGLDAKAVSTPPAPETECVIEKPVRLRSLRLSVGPVRDIAFPDQPIVACHFAERFGRWVGDLAVVLVRGQLGTELKAVRSGPGFECRKRNRAASGKLSAHALGLAVDISGFELASGDRLLATESQDSLKVELLSALRTASCGWFTTILGPGTDTTHADHCHLDIQQHGSSVNYRICQ